MGLNVYLYQFKDLDPDAILKLLLFSDGPSEAFHEWQALPESERGVFPSEKDKAEYRKKLASKARELGLPEEMPIDYPFGGTRVSFPSRLHPQWLIGDWYNLSTTRRIMEHFTGKELLYVFPEAKDGYFRPDWTAAKKRLSEILQEFVKLKPAQLNNFLPELSESFNYHLSQIEVMIETLDFVLNSNNPREFILLWSD